MGLDRHHERGLGAEMWSFSYRRIESELLGFISAGLELLSYKTRAGESIVQAAFTQ